MSSPISSNQSDIDNFHWVHESLYRSGQPNKRDFEQLESLGFKSIINLRKNHSDVDKAATTNLTVLEIPINTWKMDVDDIKSGLKAIQNAEKPVLLHCWHGADRTGTIVASYRMIYQNWTKEAAIEEFKHKNYGFHDRWFPNLIKLLESLNISQLKQELLVD